MDFYKFTNVCKRENPTGTSVARQRGIEKMDNKVRTRFGGLDWYIFVKMFMEANSHHQWKNENS